MPGTRIRVPKTLTLTLSLITHYPPLWVIFCPLLRQNASSSSDLRPKPSHKTGSSRHDHGTNSCLTNLYKPCKYPFLGGNGLVWIDGEGLCCQGTYAVCEVGLVTVRGDALSVGEAPTSCCPWSSHPETIMTTLDDKSTHSINP